MPGLKAVLAYGVWIGFAVAGVIAVFELMYQFEKGTGVNPFLVFALVVFGMVAGIYLRGR